MIYAATTILPDNGLGVSVGMAPLTVSANVESGPMPGNIEAMTWDWGDGSVPQAGGFNGSTLTHEYTEPGTYTITYNGTFSSTPTPISGTWEVQVTAEPEVFILDNQQTLFLPLDSVTDDEYSRIQMRGVTNAIPQKILDNGGYPNRLLYLWPIPSESTQAVELWLWEPLNIVDLDEQLNLPPGYERYLIYALAMELCDEFGKKPTPEIVDSLIEAENGLKSLNQTVFLSSPSKEALALTSPPVYNYIDFISGGWMLPRRQA